MLQWLRLYASSAEAAGSIPGWGTMILLAARQVLLQVFPYTVSLIVIFKKEKGNKLLNYN